jgi:hypothetical protein
LGLALPLQVQQMGAFLKSSQLTGLTIMSFILRLKQTALAFWNFPKPEGAPPQGTLNSWLKTIRMMGVFYSKPQPLAAMFRNACELQKIQSKLLAFQRQRPSNKPW